MDERNDKSLLLKILNRGEEVFLIIFFNMLGSYTQFDAKEQLYLRKF